MFGGRASELLLVCQRARRVALRRALFWSACFGLAMCGSAVLAQANLDPSTSEPTAATTEATADSASLGSEFWEAMSGGKLDGYARFRFEQVDDNQLPAVRHAYASTLRTTFGYGTRLFRNVGLYAQVENVHRLGDTLYNDGGGNGITQRGVVVDPEGTELQQAFVRFRGIPRTQVLLGRQEIEHRAAPQNRFVGAIPWQQNWQSFDGARVISDYVPGLKTDYSFVNRANRIFGDNNPLPDRSHFDLNGHLLNVSYSGIPYSTLEGYAYVLDFDSNLAATHRFPRRAGRDGVRVLWCG